MNWRGLKLTRRGQRLRAWVDAAEGAIGGRGRMPQAPAVPSTWAGAVVAAMVEVEMDSRPVTCSCRETCSRCEGTEYDALMVLRSIMARADVVRASHLRNRADHAHRLAAWHEGRASGMALLMDMCGHAAEAVDLTMRAERAQAEHQRERAQAWERRARP